jgi:hypothetical protein
MVTTAMTCFAPHMSGTPECGARCGFRDTPGDASPWYPPKLPPGTATEPGTAEAPNPLDERMKRGHAKSARACTEPRQQCTGRRNIIGPRWQPVHKRASRPQIRVFTLAPISPPGSPWPHALHDRRRVPRRMPVRRAHSGVRAGTRRRSADGDARKSSRRACELRVATGTVQDRSPVPCAREPVQRGPPRRRPRRRHRPTRSGRRCRAGPLRRSNGGPRRSLR